MLTKAQIITEIEQIPDTLLPQILDFILLLKSRNTQSHLNFDSSPVSENPSQDDKPIWEIADRIIADIPEHILNQLPPDGASQHDHYLYGADKR